MRHGPEDVAISFLRRRVCSSGTGYQWGMFPSFGYRRPFCSMCGGECFIAARSRIARRGENHVAYLTYVWSCERCGAESVDETLACAVGPERCGEPKPAGRGRQTGT